MSFPLIDEVQEVIEEAQEQFSSFEWTFYWGREMAQILLK